MICYGVTDPSGDSLSGSMYTEDKGLAFHFAAELSAEWSYYQIEIYRYDIKVCKDAFLAMLNGQGFARSVEVIATFKDGVQVPVQKETENAP